MDGRSRGSLSRWGSRADGSRVEAHRGVGWENYLEELAGYSVELVHNEGDYNIEGSAYFDAFTAGELSRYRVIAAFGGKWRSRSGFERVLESYVRRGGTLVMDASANMGSLYDLNRAALLGALVDRREVKADDRISVLEDFAARHPEVAHVLSASWIGEGNTAWFGATYSAQPQTTTRFRVLATLGSMPLLAEERLGAGRILWVGANLLWHAKTSGNEDEARLVRAIIDEAFDNTSTAVASRAQTMSAH